VEYIDRGDRPLSVGLGAAKISHRARPSSPTSVRDVQQNWALPNNIYSEILRCRAAAADSAGARARPHLS
jgi:hypothetical protein